MHQSGVQHIIVSCAVVVSRVLYPMSHRVDQCSISSYREALVSQAKETHLEAFPFKGKQAVCQYFSFSACNELDNFKVMQIWTIQQRHVWVWRVSLHRSAPKTPFYRRKMCKCVYELFDQHENLQWLVAQEFKRIWRIPTWIGSTTCNLATCLASGMDVSMTWTPGVSRRSHHTQAKFGFVELC